MTSRRYIANKYIYDSDLGTQHLLFSRTYLDENNNPIVPLTRKFSERIIITNWKVSAISRRFVVRRFEAQVRIPENVGGLGTFRQVIPFRNPEEIRTQLIQIIALDSVICGDYRGENSGVRTILEDAN